MRPKYSPKTNIWILIRSPGDSVREPVDKPSIQPFSTGFRNASDSELQSFFESATSRIHETNEPPEVAGMLTFETFVVLDEQSLDVRTAVIYNKQSVFDDADKQSGAEWRQTKVKFEGTWYLVSALEEKPHTIYLKDELAVGWGKGEQFDENGVYKTDDLELDD